MLHLLWFSHIASHGVMHLYVHSQMWIGSNMFAKIPHIWSCITCNRRYVYAIVQTCFSSDILVAHATLNTWNTSGTDKISVHMTTPRHQFYEWIPPWMFPHRGPTGWGGRHHRSRAGKGQSDWRDLPVLSGFRGMAWHGTWYHLRKQYTGDVFHFYTCSLPVNLSTYLRFTCHESRVVDIEPWNSD